ncbi:MAG: glycoside hydrolase family 127 protein [Alicyclobacillus macrosporangiidus]|uniref:glycoside hydrolase family 127 protein n=1 Tax=Alicyclobacillus macrosporangiidus TaxID=392015 RepID=UPI0026E99DB8|nr:beta-L-arabinofuranosidase domain-containing protein [Alicyclobacillus macrosporangiidus]MCL6599947.1 glycoside hydrolase family 127 protein [Alicyclobacillus macrosporangiidus]
MKALLTPVSIHNVRITGGLFRERLDVVCQKAIPYQWSALNDKVTGAARSHAVDNFRIAAGEYEGKFYGKVFQDSDVYKWLEAVSYSLVDSPNAELEQIADDVIDLISKSQQPDGYVNTYITLVDPTQRWKNLRDNHELYCAGHLIEAAVAYYCATGKAKLLEVARRFADYIDTVFGTGENQLPGYPGHEEIELALVKLYRVTGEERYLSLSKYFIEQRGTQPHYFEIEAAARNETERQYDNTYYQAHLPVRDHHTAEGHAVRAMYLYCGVTDIALETGDRGLFDVCKRVWDNMVSRRMYITGGIGSVAFGEAFTFDYDLPNDLAYAETCAAVGVVFWGHRMLQHEADRKYADVIERALYNGVLSGMSFEGNSYFYVNPLEIWPESREKRNDRNRGRQARLQPWRQKWWEVACCPSNIARLIASLGQYIYSSSNDEIFFHLYVDSEAVFDVNGDSVSIKQETSYPWDEKVTIRVYPQRTKEFTIAVRVPGWCRRAQVSVNGDPLDITPYLERGYAKIRREWREGDRIELVFAMPVERIHANPQVRVNCGKVALQRGPVVYCLEEVDNGPVLADVSLPKSTELTVSYDKDLFGGIPVILARGERRIWSGDSLYAPATYETCPVEIRAIPYFLWANRSPGEMTVWIREC